MTPMTSRDPFLESRSSRSLWDHPRILTGFHADFKRILRNCSTHKTAGQRGCVHIGKSLIQGLEFQVLAQIGRTKALQHRFGIFLFFCLEDLSEQSDNIEKNGDDRLSD